MLLTMSSLPSSCPSAWLHCYTLHQHSPGLPLHRGPQALDSQSCKVKRPWSAHPGSAAITPCTRPSRLH